MSVKDTSDERTATAGSRLVWIKILFKSERLSFIGWLDKCRIRRLLRTKSAITPGDTVPPLYPHALPGSEGNIKRLGLSAEPPSGGDGLDQHPATQLGHGIAKRLARRATVPGRSFRRRASFARRLTPPRART